MADISSVKLPDASEYNVTDAEALHSSDPVNNLNSTSTSLPLAANMGHAIGGVISGKNLVDNPFFMVNQRGATTVTANDYGANRWKKTSGTSAIYSSDGVTLNAQIVQYREKQYPNGTYTGSIEYQDGTIEYGTVTKANDTDTIQFINRTGLTLGYAASSKMFYIYTDVVTNIRAVKLEKGQVSTLANDIAPDYALELAKCQTSTADPSDTYANQGQLMTSALQGVYGAKNLMPYPYSLIPSGGYGVTFTDVGDGTITVSGIATADVFLYLQDPAKVYLKNGQYKLSGTPHFGDTVKLRLYLTYKDTSNNTVVINVDNNTATGENTFTINGSYGDANGAACNAYIKIFNGADCSTPKTFYPMIRDARITDDTFVPFAKTNKQLTDDKAERADLSAIHATGSTNTTGSIIASGTFFYLNDQFCKALTNIAVNATFTENTNYKKTTANDGLHTVFTKTVTATTNAHGEISLQLDNAFVVLAAIIDTNDSETYVIPRGSSGGTWYAVCFSNGAITQNTSVTVKVYYISI